MGLAMEGRSSLKDLCCEMKVTDGAGDGGRKAIIERFVLRGAGDRWGLRWREGHH